MKLWPNMYLIKPTIDKNKRLVAYHNGQNQNER